LLVDNVFEHNGEDEPVPSDYVLRSGDE
jgi:hypothetical protein